MKALILAAGKGERFWPLTENNPKPLLPLANKPLLETTIEALVYSGIRDIIVLVRYQQEKIRETLGNGKRLGCEIKYAVQRRLGGTADAVASVHNDFRGESSFLVAYGDNYYRKEDVKRFVTESSRKRIGMCMGIAHVADASQFGSVKTKVRQVVSIHEKTGDHKPGTVNAGLYLLDNTIFDLARKTPKSERGEYELTDSLTFLIQNGKPLHAFSFRPNGWIGITYPWDLLEANRLAMESEKPRKAGKIEANVHIKGSVVVEEETVVKSGTYIEGPVHIGKECVIGPNAYLRSFTCTGNRVKIGAGCEVKNSIVMDDAKIPHLSYVGDSILGKACSLGAGTITANLRFDEKTVKSKVKTTWVDSNRKKLGTIVGDNVRTGINVSIFPGVKIGPDSWIGPGVVLVHDVPTSSRVKP